MTGVQTCALPIYNNALGLFQNDCAIRSISLATGNSWDDTYQYLSNKARLKGTMMDDRDFILDFLDERYERVPTYNLSVGEVSAKYNDNVILITMTGHIVCSKYGVIYDSFDCRERQAEYCWIVK